ncbi:MAG: PIN domain-containing protein [Spirochaetota bacterium]
MILVDTSSWIEQLRRDGDLEVRTRVEALLVAGEAAWCSLVELELWNGARGDREFTTLRQMAEVLVSLDVDRDVWATANATARSCRERGVTVPATDIIVAACAKRHGVRLEHNDRHFDLIEQTEQPEG